MPRRKRLASAAVLLVSAACAAAAARPGQPAPDQPAPDQPVPRQPHAAPAAWPNPATRDGALLRATMIEGHNAARVALGEPALAWDDRLAGAAQAYADDLARIGRLEHAAQPRGVEPQGENLWAGGRGAYGYDEMVRMWTDERSDFVNEPTPNFSRSGEWHKVGHYTQIVWRGTTRFGCAMASDAGNDYLVCRYAPAGNVIGRRAI